jgi:hypothetical protein
VHLARFGQEPHAICLLRLGLTLFHLGYNAEAAARSEEALVAASATAHSFTDIYARVFVGWYLADAGLTERATRLAEGMSTSKSTNRLAAIGQPMVMGWGHIRSDDVSDGIALLDEALEVAVRSMPMFEPLILILLAQAHALAGDPAAGLAVARRAHAIAVNEMPFHVPEASRVIGELLLATGRDQAEALAALSEASGTAARHGNVVHELRARTALLRAVRHVDRASVAAEEATLRVVCDRLRPGSDFAELRAARAELGDRSS